MLMSVYVRLRRLAPVTGGTVFRARYRSAWFAVSRTTTITRANMYQARRVASGEGYSSLGAPARLRRWWGQSLTALRRSDWRGSHLAGHVFVPNLRSVRCIRSIPCRRSRNFVPIGSRVPILDVLHKRPSSKRRFLLAPSPALCHKAYDDESFCRRGEFAGHSRTDGAGHYLPRGLGSRGALLRSKRTFCFGASVDSRAVSSALPA